MADDEQQVDNQSQTQQRTHLSVDNLSTTNSDQKAISCSAEIEPSLKSEKNIHSSQSLKRKPRANWTTTV